jgi:hypothetical protein
MGFLLRTSEIHIIVRADRLFLRPSAGESEGPPKPIPKFRPRLPLVFSSLPSRRGKSRQAACSPMKTCSTVQIFLLAKPELSSKIAVYRDILKA